MGTITVNMTESTLIRNKVAKPLLWIGIASIVMFFAALTSAYIVRQAEGNWLIFELPNTFFVSTALILASSLTLITAMRAAKKDQVKTIPASVGITLLLGIGFAISQFIAWGELVEAEVYFAGSESNAAGSFLYVLTALHLVHLLGGLIALIVVFYRAIRKKYHSNNLLGLQLCSTYWHFLGGLWVYLLLFLSFIR